MPGFRIICVALVLSAAAACTQGDRSAVLRGAGVGAVLGGVSAALRGGQVSTGAIIGAATGATATAVARPLRRALP